jgi:hypothetical protein
VAQEGFRATLPRSGGDILVVSEEPIVLGASGRVRAR